MYFIKKISILIIGWLFIFLGIIGLFLPFLQGILFILIGLAILSSRSEMIKSLLKKLEAKYPNQYEKLKNWRERLTSRFSKK